ncbi:hypothetical protein EG328_005028 [Venturia inaequalis]|uniref:DUF1214 domain-containing protein n=1 Tax=Venturia inaequalis TaxID=5025 RepID=A0A8H3VDV8_VENIN|nr:hypothetical protein EG328_005028 [Venturia inaequalis]
MPKPLTSLIAAIGAFVLPITCQDTCPEQAATVSALHVCTIHRQSKISSVADHKIGQYGLPLLSFEKLFKNQAVPANQMLTITALSDPSSTAVVRPNVDTLYSSVSYDVGASNLELKVPEIEPDKYWSAAFYTAYGDNYLNLGALETSAAGKYLLTLGDSASADGSIALDTSNSGYIGRIITPHPIGVLLIRTVLKSGEDMTAASATQESFTAMTVSRSHPLTGPALDATLFITASNTETEKVLTITARFTNTTFGTASLYATLALAGLSNGVYQKPECVNLAEAASIANQTVAAWPTLNSSTIALSSNWTMIDPSSIGVYGDDYVARAYIGSHAYLALVVEESIYPEQPMSFTLAADEAYLVQFAGKPPLENLGFWSLTMYNEEGYLVENTIDRYVLGDRSNLTYPGGNLVYGSDSDEPFEILVQAREPPAIWTSNWLPSPVDQAAFDMLLRFYAPAQALQEGTYEYPLITKIPAITNGSTVPETVTRFARHF